MTRSSNGRPGGRAERVLRDGVLRLCAEGRTVEVKGRARRYVDPHTGREFPAVVDVNGRLHDLGGWTVELLEAELCELSSAEVAVLLDATAGLLVEGGDGRPDVRCVLLARAAALTVVT